ncbi:unnamed protein product [Protopolystoma xenopodis]|uniref:Uncharacterized protein n=1 Tax=Protopolystoma xenopodis TaxID=117903 RepID=A0A448XHI3_9PLAT|nr:unnamed protein product [Protopolystoma xenopodis]
MTWWIIAQTTALARLTPTNSARPYKVAISSGSSCLTLMSRRPGQSVRRVMGRYGEETRFSGRPNAEASRTWRRFAERLNRASAFQQRPEAAAGSLDGVQRRLAGDGRTAAGRRPQTKTVRRICTTCRARKQVCQYQALRSVKDEAQGLSDNEKITVSSSLYSLKHIA